MKKTSLLLTFMAAAAVFAAQERPWSLIDIQNRRIADEKAQVLEESTFGPRTKWNITRTVHGSHPEKAKILAHCSLIRKGDSLLIRIGDGVKAYKSRTGAVQMVSSGVTRYLPLPANAAGKIITARFKSAVKGHLDTFVIFQKNRKNISMIRGLSAAIPQGADSAVIICRLTGPGELMLNQVTVSLQQRKMDEDIICFTMDYLDKKFYLPEKGAFPIYFSIKREFGKRQGNVKLHLDLPAGVRITGCDKAARIIDPSTVNITGSFNATITRGGGFCCWRPLMLMLETDRKLNGEVFRYHMSVNGRNSTIHELKMYTMPNFSAKTPRKIKSGIFMQWSGHLSQKMSEDYVSLLKQSGFNIFRANFSAELQAEVKKHAVDTCDNWNYIRDGYPIFPQKDNPAPFLDIEGRKVRNQLCPVEVYSRGSVYRQYILPEIQKILSKNTYFMINWEVYNSDYKGCFCKRCMAEFISYSKLPAEKVKAVWPRKVVAAFHDTWVKFRSFQHGKICKVLAEDMAAVRKGTHFMPMFSVTCFNEDSRYCPQYHPDDFLKNLKWINVWGPYLHTLGLNRPYEYVPGRYLQHYYAVVNVMEYFKKHGGENTNIMGLPYGSHAFNVNLPEAAALEMHNNFLLGYKGAMFYWFHFDYRYWSLAARANDRIAACENMVNVWPEEKNVKAVPVTPFIKPEHWKIHMGSCDWCPGLRTAKSALITKAWTKGNSTLAAVGNFWEKGDVFFRLTLPGRKGNFIIRQPYAPYKYKKVSGKELASGVLLHINPLEWEYFLIEPLQNKKYAGSPFETEKELRLLKKDIELKIAGENRLLKQMEKFFKIADYSFDETPEITASSVKLVQTRRDGRQALLISTPLYKAVLTPAESGQVRSLIIDGKEVVWQEGKSGSFGKPGFWRPKAMLIENTPFRILDIKAEKDHVKVILERPRTLGFDLEIVWKFYSDHLEESFTVRNAGRRSENTILRFHHMPMLLANHTGAYFTIGNEKFSIFEKDRFFVQKPGVLGKKANIKGGDTTFVSPKFGFKLIHRPLDPMQGYYFWNNPGAVTGTFEPVFSGTTVAPGKTHTIRQRWDIKKK